MNDIKLVLESFVNTPLIMFVGFIASISTIMCMLIMLYFLLKRDRVKFKILIDSDNLFYKYFKAVFMIGGAIGLLTFIEGAI